MIDQHIGLVGGSGYVSSRSLLAVVAAHQNCEAYYSLDLEKQNKIETTLDCRIKTI